MAVLPDARGEGAETLVLRLSGATGARLGDAEATGTIVNAGPHPREWMASLERPDEAQMMETAGTEGPVPVDRERIATNGFETNGYDLEMNAGAATGSAGAYPRQSRRLAGMTVSCAAGGDMYGARQENPERARIETTVTQMSPCLRLALSEPVSRWNASRCGDG